MIKIISTDNVGLCKKLFSVFASNFIGKSAAVMPMVEQNMKIDDGDMLNIILDQILVHRLLLEHNVSVAGSDNIPDVMLNKLAGSLAHLLTIIYQQSMFL